MIAAVILLAIFLPMLALFLLAVAASRKVNIYLDEEDR